MDLLNTQLRDAAIKELNIAHLSEDDQNKVIESVGEMLFDRVLIKIINTLPESVRAEFEELVRQNKGQEVQEMIQAHIPNYQEFIGQEIRAGLDDYKRELNKLVLASEGKSESENDITNELRSETSSSELGPTNEQNQNLTNEEKQTSPVAQSLQKDGLNVIDENGRELIPDTFANVSSESESVSDSQTQDATLQSQSGTLDPLEEHFVVDASGEATPVGEFDPAKAAEEAGHTPPKTPDQPAY